MSQKAKWQIQEGGPVGAEKQSSQPAPVKFVSIDLYERLLSEKAADFRRYTVKYSPVMRAAVEGYERARAAAVEGAERRSGNDTE